MVEVMSGHGGGDGGVEVMAGGMAEVMAGRGGGDGRHVGDGKTWWR